MVGGWQEGLVPQFGLSNADAQEIEAFQEEMVRLKNLRGADGRHAFALPLDRSSTDPVFLEWDAISMERCTLKGVLGCVVDPRQGLGPGTAGVGVVIPK